MKQQLMLDLVSEAELRELIRQVVGELLAAQVNTPLQEHHAGLLTREEAAMYLRVSVPTLHRRVQDGSLRPVHIGRRIVFQLEDLQRIVEQGSQPSSGLRRR